MKMPAVKFNKDALVGFLLNHFEKLLVAAIGLLALLLAWNGISALRFKAPATDRLPDAVARLASETVQHIDQEPNPPAEVVRATGQLAKAIDPWRPPKLTLAPAPSIVPLSRPTMADITMRGEPRVLPIQDLRAVAGIAVVKDPLAEQAANAAGAAAMDPAAPAPGTDAGTPESPEPAKRFEKLVPCVVLVGLIPTAAQQAEFRKALGVPEADQPQGQQFDAPRWGGFVVERAAAANADKPDAWTPIRPRVFADQGAGTQFPDYFLLGPEELVRADADARLVADLPPRQYEPWTLETVHPSFLEPRHKWRLETTQQIVETPVRLTPGEFRGQFADHVGHEVEVDGLKFDGKTQRTESPDMMLVGVAAADGSETFPLPDPAAAVNSEGTMVPRDTRPVFVISAEWLKTLDVKSLPACALRVVPVLDVGAAYAQVVGITPLDAAGRPSEPGQRDPRSGAVDGGGPGPGPGGGMPAPVMMGGGAGTRADHRLFRFVDNTVEYGRAYRYRVKIELANPNWGLDPKLLANPRSAEVELLETVSDPSAVVQVPLPYVTLARDSLDGGAVGGGSADGEGQNAPRPATKAASLDRNQVEVSFLGPTWRHLRGKRPDQGYDFFDYAIEHVAPVEPGRTVVWNRERDPRERKKPDPRAGKAADKPKNADPTWTLLNMADVGRDLVDFRGRQTATSGSKDAAATAGGIPEPVELALLRPDGSLEVVTAADSQWLLDAFDAVSGGSAAGMGMGPGRGPGPAAPDPLLSPGPRARP